MPTPSTSTAVRVNFLDEIQIKRKKRGYCYKKRKKEVLIIVFGLVFFQTKESE